MMNGRLEESPHGLVPHQKAPERLWTKNIELAHCTMIDRECNTSFTI